MQTHCFARTAVQRRPLLVAGASAIACALLPSFTSAQDKYPSRPIELIVPWGPGGGADQLARRLGKLLEPDLKVSLPVINVPGATGNTGMTKLLTAAPDGQTTAILIGDTLSTIAAGGRWKLDDVVPLGVMIRQPTGIYVKEDSKYKTFQDLLADARNNELKVAILGFGSADEILINQINAKGAKLRMVPFASPGERYSSILGGHADVLVEQAGDVRSFLDGKQMRPLAFFADAPAPGFPAIPLAKDSGFPIVINQFRAIVVRAGTDPKQVAMLSAALEKVARSPDFVKYLEDELAYAGSFIPAAQAGAFLERELKLIQQNAPKKQ